MKKILLSLVLVAVFFGGGHVAFAQVTSCPTGSDNECPGAQVCNTDTKLCIADPQDGLSSIGDACTNDNQCRGNTVACDPAAKKCVYASGAAPGSTPAQGIAAAQTLANAYEADAVVQQKNATAALAAGDAKAAAIASDQAQVDVAGVALQQALIKEDTLKEQGANAATIAAAQAQVDAAGAVIYEKQAVLATAKGDTAGAAQAAAQAQVNATAANTNAVAAGGPGVQASNFVPLTNLPIFGNNITSAPTLPAFLNSLYLYCVGIAAVLAVVQIMHAGILYMGGDSVTETKQAKSLIASSVLGLVLVLSPVIVFSIINPKILNLDVGFGALTPAPTSSAPAPANPSGSATPAPNTADGTVAPGGACTTDANCQDTSPTQAYGCYPEGNGKCTLNGDAVLPIPAATPLAK